MIVEKTKILIFSKGPMLKTKFYYNNIHVVIKFNLPLECQLDLFDKVVVPVLLCGSEVWGFENLDLHLKFLKTCIEFKKFHASVHGVWRNRSFSPVYFYIL